MRALTVWIAPVSMYSRHDAERRSRRRLGCRGVGCSCGPPLACGLEPCDLGGMEHICAAQPWQFLRGVWGADSTQRMTVLTDTRRTVRPPLRWSSVGNVWHGMNVPHGSDSGQCFVTDWACRMCLARHGFGDRVCHVVGCGGVGTLEPCRTRHQVRRALPRPTCPPGSARPPRHPPRSFGVRFDAVAGPAQPSAIESGRMVVVHDHSSSDRGRPPHIAHSSRCQSSSPIRRRSMSDKRACSSDPPAASAPRRMVSDEATTYLLMLDRSEWPSASAAAFRSPVAARNQVAYLARSLWAV